MQGRNLEFSTLSGCVTCGWALYAAERYFIRGFGAMSAQWERDFQQHVFLMPVCLHLDINSWHTRVHRDVLNKG